MNKLITPLFIANNMSDKRLDSMQLLTDIVSERKIVPLQMKDKAIVDKYIHDNLFADMTFSMLWAWNETYNYCLREFDGVLFVVGVGITDTVDCSIVRIGDASVSDTLDFAYAEFTRDGHVLTFENISERDANEISRYYESIGKRCSVSFDEDFSDYLYLTEDFLNLSGTSNRGKRSGFNNFMRYHENAEYIKYKPELRADAMKVFDSWCSCHECSVCTYGCEKNAFGRMLDIFDDEIHHIGMVYENSHPISFAVAEHINDDTVSYYMQKNACRTSGLTFYLNLKMSQDEAEAKYINLGEDMGLPGLRRDKQNYHPVMMLNKYTVKVYP